MDSNRNLVVALPAGVRDKFSAKVRGDGHIISWVVRKFCEDYISGRIKIENNNTIVQA